MRRLRDVRIASEEDGIAALVAYLDSATARAVLSAVDAAVTDPSIPTECGGVTLHASVDLVLPWGQVADGTGPEFEALGRLLTDPAVTRSLRPVVAHPDGHVLDVGRRAYALPTALRRLIVARDATCRFPGCTRPASRCQVDHADSWDEGGRSDVANLGALCTRHHQAKTHAGWRIVDSHADGSCTWVSPLGRRYARGPTAVVAIPPPQASSERVATGPPPF